MKRRLWTALGILTCMVIFLINMVHIDKTERNEISSNEKIFAEENATGYDLKELEIFFKGKIPMFRRIWAVLQLDFVLVM